MSENSERIAKNCERKKLDFEKSIRTFIIYGFKRILKKKFNLAKRVTKNSKFFSFHRTIWVPTPKLTYLQNPVSIFRFEINWLTKKKVDFAAIFVVDFEKPWPFVDFSTVIL